jgi:hypothetical protein
MASRTSLKLNGKPLEPSNKQRIQQTIASIPHGHLLSTQELAAKANVHPNDMAMRHPDLNDHRRLHNNKAIWGSKKTIAAYDQQMSEAK